jgi:hypothetical protein
MENRMNKMFSRGVAVAGLCGMLGLAHAAWAADNDVKTEVRPVDAKVVRVRIDGTVNVTIRQGNPPALTLNGNPRWVSRTTTTQSGDTLSIDADGGGHARMGATHIELVLPALRAVTSEGLGSTDVAGFSGDELTLTLDGAGSMKVMSGHRLVTANLGGLGSMDLGANGERVVLNLQGAGFLRLSGRGTTLKAALGGLGNLDAQQFNADNVDVDLSGFGNAAVTARQNANLNLSGLGSVTVYGKPQNRKVAVDGLGKVSWK